MEDAIKPEAAPGPTPAAAAGTMPAAAPNPVSLAASYRIWRQAILLCLALLTLLVAGFVFQGGEKQFSPQSNATSLTDARWTNTERSQLAKSRLATTGLPGRGPQPLVVTAERRGADEPMVEAIDLDGSANARRSYEDVVRQMQGWFAQAAAADAGPPADSTRAQRLPELLRGAGSRLSNASQPAIYYHLALLSAWGGLPDRTLTALTRSNCVPPLAESAAAGASQPARGLMIQCLWLAGRAREAKARGSGIAYFRAAVSRALNERRQDQHSRIFQMNRWAYRSDINLADLWRDYLASLLASTQPLPIDPKMDKAVFELDGEELTGKNELIAMLKMLLARQGNIEQLSKLPAVAANASDPARELSEAADIFANRAAEGVPERTNEVDQQELQNWAAHNCERGRLLGLDAKCAGRTGQFKEWEADWKSELNALIDGEQSWSDWIMGAIWALLYWGLLVFLVWAASVSALHARQRLRHYRARVHSFHFERSSTRSPEQVGLAVLLNQQHEAQRAAAAAKKRRQSSGSAGRASAKPRKKAAPKASKAPKRAAASTQPEPNDAPPSPEILSNDSGQDHRGD